MIYDQASIKRTPTEADWCVKFTHFYWILRTFDTAQQPNWWNPKSIPSGTYSSLVCASQIERCAGKEPGA